MRIGRNDKGSIESVLLPSRHAVAIFSLALAAVVYLAGIEFLIGSPDSAAGYPR